MKKRDIAINAALLTVLIAFVLNMLEDGYLKFPDLRPIAETELAKVLEGDKKGCLTTPTQTKPVSMEQALNLESKTARQVLNELGNHFCEGKNNTLHFLTTSGKRLYVQIGETLDQPIKYGFDIPKDGAPPEAAARSNRSNLSVPASRETRSEGKELEKR